MEAANPICDPKNGRRIDSVRKDMDGTYDVLLIRNSELSYVPDLAFISFGRYAVG
jgi:hypothetical protein